MAKKVTPQLDLSRVNLQSIPLNKVRVDRKTYQRAFKEPRVQQIVNEFDEDLFDPISVVKMDRGNGVSFHTPDGGNRCEALRRMGYKEVIANVRHNISPKKQAQMFYNQRNRSNPSPLERFRAQLFAGEAEAVAINAAAQAAGFKIAIQQPGRKRNGAAPTNGLPTIHAVAAMEMAYRNYGAANFAQSLQVMAQLWSGDSNVVDSAFIKAFCRFHRDFQHRLGNPHLTYATKLVALGSTQPTVIVQRARSRHAISAGGGSLTKAIYSELKSVTNMRGRPRKDAAWKKSGRTRRGVSDKAKTTVKA